MKDGNLQHIGLRGNQTKTIQPASRLGNIEEYYFSKKLREIAAMRQAGKDVLNLGIGSPDLPPHPEVIAALTSHAASPDQHGYQGYYGIPELRQAFAKWYGQHFSVQLNAEDEVLPLIGSKEGIVHLAMSFLEKGDAALVPNPGYPSYAAATKLAGAEVVEYPLAEGNGWLPDLEALEKTDLSRVKIMWVSYPHMPTGASASLAFFEILVAFAKRHHLLLVNDNPYAFTLQPQLLSILAVPGATDVALELNSLSKSHNMAGWRVGALVGNAELVRTVVRFKSNMDSGMFRPVQLAAAKALALPASWYSELNDIYRRRKKKVEELLTWLGCTWDASAGGMFVWAKVPAGWQDGFEFSEMLLEKAHVFLTPGGIFGSQGNGYVRPSLCSSEEVFDEAMQRIRNSRFVTRDSSGHVHANHQSPITNHEQ